MRMYVVRVSSYLPYKIEREYHEKAERISTAVRSAVHKYRKDERIKGMKIDNMQIQLGAAAL